MRAAAKVTGVEGLPADRQVAVPDLGDRSCRADQSQNRLAPEADVVRGQDRLVLAIGKDGEAVDAGHVGGGQDADAEALLDGGEVAQGERRAGMRRADGAELPGIEGDRIGGEGLAAVDLALAVQLEDAGADGGALMRLCLGLVEGTRHRIDDLSVAGAAAEHAAQGVLDGRARWPRVAGEKIACGHQHAGRAGAALGGARLDEGVLQSGHGRVGGEAFDGGDRAIRHLAERNEAGADLGAVEQHRAGTAIAGITADLGAGLSPARRGARG